MVTTTLERLLPGKIAINILRSVHLQSDAIDLVVPVNLARALAARIGAEKQIAQRDQQCVLTIPISLPLRGGRHSITAGQPDAADHDATLISALRKAHAMVDRDERGQAIIVTAPTSPYERRLLGLCGGAGGIRSLVL